MKILYIASSAVPSTAANSVHVMKMAQALADNQNTVTLTCPTPAEKDQLPNNSIYDNYGVKANFLIKQHGNTRTRLALFIYAFKNALHARKNKFDVAFSRCLLTAFLCSTLGVKTIFERHDAFENQGKLALIIFKSLMKKKSTLGLVVISHSLKSEMIKNFYILEDKIYVAPDAADELVPQASPPFNKKENKLHAGYVGHLYKGRGIEVIIHLAENITDAEFHIVGGTKEDVNYWNKRLNSLKNIHLYGHLPHKDAAKYLQHFDVLLAPYQSSVSVSQGGDTVQWMSPLKIFEYMSTGKPMICSDLPVLKEVLINNENSYLCSPDNAQEWVDAVNYIKDNPDKSALIGQNARDSFLKNYTWHKRSQKILKRFS